MSLTREQLLNKRFPGATIAREDTEQGILYLNTPVGIIKVHPQTFETLGSGVTCTKRDRQRPVRVASRNTGKHLVSMKNHDVTGFQSLRTTTAPALMNNGRNQQKRGHGKGSAVIGVLH